MGSRGQTGCREAGRGDPACGAQRSLANVRPPSRRLPCRWVARAVLPERYAHCGREGDRLIGRRGLIEELTSWWCSPGDRLSARQGAAAAVEAAVAVT